MSKKKWQKVTNKTLLLPPKYVWQVIYHHLFQAIPTCGCGMSSMENNLKLLSKYWFVISNLEGWVLAAGPMVLVHIECIWTHHSITALLVTVVSQSWPRFLQKIEDFFGQINFSTKLLRWWFHKIFERKHRFCCCRIPPGSGGAQAPQVFRALTRLIYNSLKVRNSLNYKNSLKLEEFFKIKGIP